MNVERLNIIAEWLEAGAPHKDGIDGFNMEDWHKEDECGTTCCIAGAAIQFFETDSDPNTPLQTAARLIGLDSRDASELFYATDVDDPLENISAAWAARCIRKLIATGEVDWEGTR